VPDRIFCPYGLRNPESLVDGPKEPPARRREAGQVGTGAGGTGAPATTFPDGERAGDAVTRPSRASPKLNQSIWCASVAACRSRQ
jgi:hypothetical protein